MTWLTLRLQRGELILLLAIAIGVFAAFVATYDVIQLTWGGEWTLIDGCLVPQGANAAAPSCNAVVNNLYPWVRSSITVFVVLPLVLALVLALPLIQELHDRTYRLAWTQSVTRWRWARVHAAMILVIGLALISGSILLVRWWPNRYYNWWGTELFDVLGIVNLGWFVFAAGLILALGTVLRRPLIALALGVIGYGLARIVFADAVRPYLIAPEQTDLPASGFVSGEPWLLGTRTMWPDGTLITSEAFQALCPPLTFSPTTTEAQAAAAQRAFNACLDANGIMTHYTYQPVSRYWPLQFAETGLLIAVGSVLIGWSVWYWLRRLE